MANGQDLVWVARKPKKTILSDVTVKSTKTKAKPKPEVPLAQQSQGKSPSSITTDEPFISEQITKNLTFSNLCQEDKDKIGALIRKVVSLKVENAKEVEKAKIEKQKFDEQLRSLQERNRQTQHQTSDLKRHFSSSLALLKVYKEKVHRLGSEKVEHDKKISELTKELENLKQELGILREAQRSTDSVRQSSETISSKEECNNMKMTEPILGHLARENERLQRLLDIQTSRRILKPPIESESHASDSSCNQERTERQDRSQTICKRCNECVDPARPRDPSEDPPMSAEGMEEKKDIIVNDSDDEQALIKELNNHRLHVETLLFMDNDVSLLKSLESIGTCEERHTIPTSTNYQSDSDDENLLKMLTEDLNRRPLPDSSD